MQEPEINADWTIGKLADRILELKVERDAYLENLTATQKRCTELLEENRALKLTPPGLPDAYADAICGLVAGLVRAREKHPNGANMYALMEEVGEVCRALRREGGDRVSEELMDVAVVAMRIWVGEVDVGAP
jgi:hypothetical protein